MKLYIYTLTAEDDTVIVSAVSASELEACATIRRTYPEHTWNILSVVEGDV